MRAPCGILLASVAAAAPPAWTEFPLRSESQARAELPGGGGGARVQAIAWCPSDPTRVVIGTDRNGVWFSDDGGATLRPARGLPLPDIKTLRFSPWRPKTVLCLAAARDAASFAATRGEGLWQSGDGGATWSFLLPVPLEESAFGGLIVFAESKDARAVIAGSHGRGLLVSLDGGDSWEWRRLGIEGRVAGLAAAGGAVVAATSEGVFRAPDLGLEFTAVPDLSNARFVSAAGEVLAVGGGGTPAIYLAWPDMGLYVSADLGLTWTPLGKRTLKPERYFASIAASSRREGLLFAMERPVGKKLVKLPLFSADGGASWREPEDIRALGRFAGPAACAPEAVAFHPQSSGAALAGIDRELMRTADGGYSWQPWGAGLFGWESGGERFAAREAAGGRRLWLALGEAGLWVSENAGRSFKPVARAGDRCLAVACHAGGAGTTLLAWWQTGGQRALMTSADGGVSWRAAAEPAAVRPTLCFHPVKHGTIFAGDLVSENGGASFTRAAVEVFAICPRTGDVRYGADPEKPWQILCARGGAWEPFGADLPGAPRSAAVNPENAGDLFVGTTAGLFRQKDGAWRRCEPRARALPAEPLVAAIVFDAYRPGRIVAAVRDPWLRRGGLLESLNNGEDWEYEPRECAVRGAVQLGRDEFLAATDVGFFLVGPGSAKP
ncbi:MAG TPA: hypothetical protein DCM87_03905 [Planctomycetes bacterium]|nr:hypothetical protein [Planctomycetota bacterium]